ncbi:hypothetical protein Plec18167_009205 [Paecilomyces lecythidis]|uniref:Uncharacterized protein n=1 Tax=Paecilomyces lecythidis TaxID=3004212 RepID=A0ABR3WQU0_9EURO
MNKMPKLLFHICMKRNWMELFSTFQLSFLVAPFLVHPRQFVGEVSHVLALDDQPLWMAADPAVSVLLRLDADHHLGVDTLGRGQWTDMIATVHGLYHGPGPGLLGVAALTLHRHTQGLLHPGETRYEEIAPDAADAAVLVTALTVATVAGAEARAGIEAVVDTALGEDKWASRRYRAIGLIMGGICFVVLHLSSAVMW